MRGFDTGADCSRYAARLAGIGYRFGIRYLAGPGDWRHWSREEAEAMGRAGLLCVSVSQQGLGNKFGAELGKRQAEHALARAKAVGQPEGTAIYYAIDTDMAKAADVIAHFEAIKTAGLPYERGVYGPGKLCALLRDELGLVIFTWLANARAWPGYAQWKAQADIIQGLPMRPFPPDAFAIDPCESIADSGFGEWSALE